MAGIATGAPFRLCAALELDMLASLNSGAEARMKNKPTRGAAATTADSWRASGQTESLDNCEVLVVADIFRLVETEDGGDLRWHQEHNVRWVTALARAAFAADPAVRVGVLDHATLDLTEGNFGPADGQSATQWWIESLRTPIIGTLAERIRTAVKGKVVIGFEIPAILRDLLEEYARLLVEIELAPIRFLDDLLLSISSTDHEINAALRQVRVSQREIHWQAELLRAKALPPCAARSEAGGRVALLAGQTRVDRSLVKEGNLLSLSDYVQEVNQLCEEHDLVLIRPHPHSGDDVPGLESLLEIPGLRITNANSYDLIASGKIETVAAISSSLLDECKYFGISTQRFDRSSTREGAFIRAQSFASEVADAIGSVAGFQMQPLNRALPEGTILKQLVGLEWGSADCHRGAIPLAGIDLEAIGAGKFPITEPKMAAGLTYGWYPIEGWGVWGKSVSVLSLSWPVSKDSPIICELELTPFAGNRPSQRIDLWSDGLKLVSAFLPANGMTRIALELDVPRRPGPVQIFLSSNAGRPSESDADSSDHRTLGVGLVSFAWR